jgi:hypothetical protein
MKSCPNKRLPQLTPVVPILLTILSCGPVWAANGSETASLGAGGLPGSLFAVLALVWTLGLYLQSTRRRMI